MEPDGWIILEDLKDAKKTIKGLEEERDWLYRQLEIETDDWDEEEEDEEKEPDEDAKMLKRYHEVVEKIGHYEVKLYKIEKEIEDIECKLKCRFYKKWNLCPKHNKSRCAYQDMVNYKKVI